MSWKDDLPACFDENWALAETPEHERMLRTTTINARGENVRFSEFEKEIVYYLYRCKAHPGGFISHVNEQIARAELYW
ncbi:hypothetical protein G5B46_07205 [Caulobacter sp. 602-2]|uniref:Uncharacterized protein n=1 Tax=Caulobacter sp. 602-2 TaxID=2710887 RepID=A0A6G4QWR7_9CAUL|nr:hypothetical protein [Caulobacter sp. 602-2]NGM49388.1 hypothetical protein [Caulobacter sp. 602-2]